MSRVCVRGSGISGASPPPVSAPHRPDEPPRDILARRKGRVVLGDPEHQGHLGLGLDDEAAGVHHVRERRHDAARAARHDRPVRREAALWRAGHGSTPRRFILPRQQCLLHYVVS